MWLSGGVKDAKGMSLRYDEIAAFETLAFRWL